MDSNHFLDARGAVAVIITLLLVALLGFGALAVDIGSVFVVRNELQNAADAGALAAARRLYMANGETINPGANVVGVNAAKANTAQNVAVELTGDPAANSGDVQRGHWRWTDHSFTPNSSLLAVALNEVSNADLDANNNFINAVRVKVRREATPVRSYFSQAIGFSDLPMQAEAVAYIGFSGTFLEGEADGPFVLCEQALLNAQGKYSCSTGRMINSGGGDTHNTAGWSNFTQEPCVTASAVSVRPYVPYINTGCSATPNPEIAFQVAMGTTGGELQNNWDRLYNCWIDASDTDADGYPDKVYNLTLPVVDCPGNNVATCSKLVGGANVDVLWMIRQAANPAFDWAPVRMTGGTGFNDWECPLAYTGGGAPKDLNESQFRACWGDFTAHFNLVNYAGVSVSTFSDSDLNTTMFFVPNCATHTPIGVTAGPNLGVLAKIPVLVQ